MVISQKQNGLPPKSQFGCRHGWCHNTQWTSGKIIHTMRFSGGSRTGPQGGPKMAWESRKGQLAWSLTVIRGQGWGAGSHTWTRAFVVWSSHQHQGNKCPGFLIGLSQCAVEREGKWWAWKLSGVTRQKLRQTLYYIYPWCLMTEMCHVSFNWTNLCK